jgi:hypothetical protein
MRCRRHRFFAIFHDFPLKLKLRPPFYVICAQTTPKSNEFEPLQSESGWNHYRQLSAQRNFYENQHLPSSFAFIRDFLALGAAALAGCRARTALPGAADGGRDSARNSLCSSIAPFDHRSPSRFRRAPLKSNGKWDTGAVGNEVKNVSNRP